MEFKEDFRNELLKRREIQGVFQSAMNPGFGEVAKRLAENLKVKEEHLVVKTLKNNFGSNEFLIEAFVYDSKEDKERIEPRVKAKKAAAV